MPRPRTRRLLRPMQILATDSERGGAGARGADGAAHAATVDARVGWSGVSWGDGNHMTHKRLMRLRWTLCDRARDAARRAKQSKRLDVQLRVAGMATAYRRAAKCLLEAARCNDEQA